jgi:hypothetical protein
MARRGAMTRAPALRGQARRDFKAQKAAQPAAQAPMPQQQQQQVPAQQPQPGALSGALAGAMQGYAQGGGITKPNPREQWLQQQQQQWRSQELTPEEANMQIPVGGGFMGNPNYYGGQGQSPMPMDKMYRFPQPVGGAQMSNTIGAVAGNYQQAVVPDQSMQQQQFQRMPMPTRKLY